MDNVKKLLGMGGNDGAKMAAAQAAASNRMALAQVARDSANSDAAGQRSGSKKGRALLSFLGAEGAGGLSAA